MLFARIPLSQYPSKEKTGTGITQTNKQNASRESFDTRLAQAKGWCALYYITNIPSHSNHDELITSYIESRKDCWSGEPYVKGTRIRVLDVVQAVCMGPCEE
jgi:hypothetical protein